MTKKEAIDAAFKSTSYIGSHRPSVFCSDLEKNGYKVVKIKKQRK